MGPDRATVREGVPAEVHVEPRQRTAAAALAAALTLSAAAGCGRKSEAPGEEPRVQETGKEVSKNPFTALQQLGDAAQKAGEKMQQAASRPPVEPVNLDQLTPFVGEVAGWTGEEPKGSKTQMGEWKVTEVSRRYTQAADPTGNAPRIAVQITDGGFVPAIYAPFHMMTAFSQETLDGYHKGLTIDGYPAFEKWTKKRKDLDLTLLVADRFLVNVKSDGIEPATLHDWLGNLRLKELAGLK